MPLLSTIGSASAKQFGMLAPAGDISYPYYHSVGNSLQQVGSIYGTDPDINSSAVLLQTDSSGTINNRSICIFAKDNLIAGPYFGSTDSGASWLSWGVWWVATPSRGGLNGVIAHNPTNNSVVQGFFAWYGSNSGFEGIHYIKADGTYGTTTNNYFGGFVDFSNIIYSTALDAFFLVKSDSTVKIYSGSSFSLLSNGFISANINYPLFVSSDGYPLFLNVSGTTYRIYKITDTSLSTTLVGTVSDSYRTVFNPSIIWSTTDNLYYKIAISGNQIFFSSSSNGYTWTFVNSLNISGMIAFKGIHLWLDGSSIYIQGSYYDLNQGWFVTLRYVSTNGGTSWTDITNSSFGASTKRIV